MDLSSKELSRALRNLKIIDPKEYDELMKLAGQLGELEEIDKAKTDFLAFVRLVWPAALIGRHHQEMARVIEGVVLGDKKRAIVNMAPRMPYALDTPVPTPVGWKTIGTLEIGDMVFGPDGKPVRVVGKSPVMRKPLYEVETVDGCKIVCSDDHEWHVRIGRQGYHRRTTEELYVRQVTAKKWFKSPFLLPGKPVEYPAQELPVDPYVLGVWLGDGHNKQAVITSHDDDASQIRAQFESRGYETTDQTTHMTFGVKKLRVALRELGVLGDKHIPEQYLLGSVAQRMDLLRGLMDTDGCVQKNGQCVFSQKKRAIVESVRMLVLSLGGKCRVYSVPAILRGVYYGEQWVIAFFLKDCCYLERKKSRTRDNRVSRSIRVKPLGVEGDVQCIEVDSKEGLFQGPDYCVVTNSKSEFFSYLMPAWLLGQKPDSKVIQICGTGDMAIGWSRKVRNLINTPEYQKIFPGVKLRQDSKAAGRWHTSHDGEYFAVGAEGNVTGRGGNVIIIDDPTGEQQAVTALTDPSIYRKVYDWYIAGPRQRLQPNGRICVVQSRWATNDFTGQLLKAERENEGAGADHWEVVELPAILPSGESIWPEFWSKAQLEATRLALPPHRWNAQYQQQPSAAESALLKKEYWRKWEGARPPECHFKMVTMDTAYSDKETADFTAVTTWGIFRGESPAFVKGSGFDPGGRDFDCLILLDAWKARINFPELKTAAHKHWLKWNPDVFMVETKASGTPLIHELRARGIPISEYTPVRGTKLAPNNKVVRVNAVTDILASGIVYAPELRWAEEVIEECHQFPGEFDDYVDCVVMALSRFRQGGLIRLPTDEDWDTQPINRHGHRYY